MTNPVLKSIAEKVIAPVICFFNFPLAFLVGKSEKIGKAILRPLMKSYTRHSKDSIYQYTRLPKQVETLPAEWPEDGRFVDYAIILQGPIRTEDNFTVDTVKYYKRCYPGASVIVSTWPGSDPNAKEEVQKIGAIWVENQPPINPGGGNVNMQLASSLGGIKKAKSLGCKYAMKTRTDQRVYSNDVLQYFRNLQEMFPSANAEVIPERLVFISCGQSFRYIPFHLCDYLVFGKTEELIRLYGIENDPRPNVFTEFSELQKAWEIDKAVTDILESHCTGSPYDLYPDFEDKYYKYRLGEVYIAHLYFSENICRLNPGDDLLDAYYYYLKNYAIVADSEKVMLYWPKYFVCSVTYDNEIIARSKMDFKKWLEVYLHYEPKKDWIAFAHPCGDDGSPS